MLIKHYLKQPLAIPKNYSQCTSSLKVILLLLEVHVSFHPSYNEDVRDGEVQRHSKAVSSASSSAVFSLVKDKGKLTSADVNLLLSSYLTRIYFFFYGNH